MTDFELEALLAKVQDTKCETNTLEIKSARKGCPERLYDTLSSFSNQDVGGTILFGIDEADHFAPVGVYDPQDLQKKVTEQCGQMTPPVRPVFSVLHKNGKTFVSVEIPGIDALDRPCFYTGKGRLRGAYIRVGDADEPMTEYEIYSYEAFRKKTHDELRTADSVYEKALDPTLLQEYILRLKKNKPNLSAMPQEEIETMMGLKKNGTPTLAAITLFGVYPQSVYPQLCITAVSVPGTQIGDVADNGERFLDNKRIEGTLSQMLEDAILFIRKNTRISTVIDPTTGVRKDRAEYPTEAVREAILNALIHRDYSVHTENMPIQILLFRDRLEIRNPGGLYGRMTVDSLGKTQPDTRNPVIAFAMEVSGFAENRYSGIPTIRNALKNAALPEPVFLNQRGTFTVIFRNSRQIPPAGHSRNSAQALLSFCSEYRTRREIADFLGISTVTHAIKKHVLPLIEQGAIVMEIPEHPKSPKQRYIARGLGTESIDR